MGQIAGEIGSAAAQSKAGQLASLSNANEEMKQQNFWKGISGLNSAASQYGGAGATSISGAGNAAESSVNAGQLKLASQQAGWADVGGMISAAGGLVSAGADAFGA